MNYLAARQRQSDGRWDYTQMNDGIVWPIGYCHAYKPFDDSANYLAPGQAAQLNAAEADFIPKYHADGHATEDEACACYREYLLDHKLRLGLKDENTQEKCKVCGEFTQGRAECDHRMFVLCDQHNNRAEVEKLFGAVGWSAES